MFEEIEEEIYGCWNCGKQNGDYEYNEYGEAVCSECNRPAIIGLEEALDILKDLNLKGVYKNGK